MLSLVRSKYQTYIIFIIKYRLHLIIVKILGSAHRLLVTHINHKPVIPYCKSSGIIHKLHLRHQHILISVGADQKIALIGAYRSEIIESNIGFHNSRIHIYIAYCQKFSVRRQAQSSRITTVLHMGLAVIEKLSLGIVSVDPGHICISKHRRNPARRRDSKIADGHGSSEFAQLFLCTLHINIPAVVITDGYHISI